MLGSIDVRMLKSDLFTVIGMENMQTNLFGYHSNKIMCKSCFPYISHYQQVSLSLFSTSPQQAQAHEEYTHFHNHASAVNKWSQYQQINSMIIWHQFNIHWIFWHWTRKKHANYRLAMHWFNAKNNFHIAAINICQTTLLSQHVRTVQSYQNWPITYTTHILNSWFPWGPHSNCLSFYYYQQFVRTLSLKNLFSFRFRHVTELMMLNKRSRLSILLVEIPPISYKTEQPMNIFILNVDCRTAFLLQFS